MNTIIGKICAYPSIKDIISKNVQIVLFFKYSYYWSGQLVETAKTLGVTQRLKTYTEIRWYSMVLQALSIQEYQYVDNK